MSKKFFVLMSILLVAAMVFTGCSKPADAPEVATPDAPTDEPAPEPTGEKILRANNASEPGSLDPALAQGTHESWVLDHSFEGLMKLDQEGHVASGMAEDYKISDDFLTYTFTLRDGIKWSNGDPVTAEDFEFAWKRAIDPELAADYAFQIADYVKGGNAYLSGEGSLDDVAIKALDDKTLEVTLEAPTAYFLELTAFYTYYPVNKNVVEANPDWAKSADTHVSNGPFYLTEWEHDASLKMRKNDNYYDADKVHLDGIDLTIIDDENTTWQAYEGGEYDLLLPIPQAVVAKMKDEGNPELVLGGEVGTYYFNLNNDVKPFNNAKVRKGLSYALDKATITDKIAQGGQMPAEGVVPFGMFDEDGKEYRDKVGNLIPYDLDLAKNLFEEGLAEEGMTIDDFNSKGFVLLYNTQESHKKIAQAAQEMWRTNLGIEIGLENVDFQVKLDREKAGDYDISRAGWIGDYMDPMTFIDLWYSKSSFNDANYNNPKYDELVLKAKSTADQKVRFEAMREAENILMDEMPIVPVYFYTQPYAQKPYVTGVYKPLVNYPRLTYADINK
ncbi:peptide ABC transporter substrate-binding protein [Paratissierella segnis]|jgi:oligopeptide transport system substrate-binding protein|uniref:Peptide ABC transporter substrate-binding protein n=1 Tax=Paratissierella segnis TaxID=2763679 RepID=A0A926EV04_9FIRM|nr:peptide ABC transporter substrate-binding protein [Paratissierella segnis]MBC8589010.1 peptide ABC transporter substrate-binding protein [Paratissierella segnis]